MRIRIDNIQDGNSLRSLENKEALQELMESIQEHGVIAPIKVREIDKDKYEIVYGHRRVEACRRLGLEDIEANIDGVDDLETLLQGLIENIQRENLSDMEEGEAFKSIKDQTGWSDEKIGKSVGKSETYVGDRLRLIKDTNMNPLAQEDDAARKAQFIRQVEKDAPELVKPLAQKVVDEGLTSRQTEKIVNEVKKTLPIYGKERTKSMVIDRPFEQFRETFIEPEHKPTRQQPESSEWEKAIVAVTKQEEYNLTTLEFKGAKALLLFLEKNKKKDEYLKTIVAYTRYFCRVIRNLLTDWENLYKEITGEDINYENNN